MVPTGAVQEEKTMHNHRCPLPRVVIIVSVKVQVIIRRR